MTGSARSYPVAPDSVYVWRGFMSPKMNYAEFVQFLGGVFVPACALLQPPVGLRAYLPTMVPQAAKPPAVPDQTALMFWATPGSHDLAAKAIAVRIYQNLHGDVYDMTRSALPEVPVALPAAALVPEQPYFLINQPADWMLGSTRHLVGSRPPAVAPAAFLASAFAWAQGFAKQPPDGVDGALVCCGNDYGVAWAHGKEGAPGLDSALDGFASLTVPTLSAAALPLRMREGLWDSWDGLDLAKNACLSLQFKRPAASQAAPRERGGQ